MSREVHIPDGWASVRLKDVARINPDKLGDGTDPDCPIDYIDLSAVESTTAVPSCIGYRFADAPSRARRLVESGDILVSTVRPYLRAFTRVPEIDSNSRLRVASTGFAVVRPSKPSDASFVYQHILGGRFVAWLLPLMTGSNYPAVNAEDVGDYPMLWPPEGEREFIGAVLAAVDDAIDATRRVIEQTRRLKTAVLQDLLTRGLPGRHSEFREIKGLGQVPQAWKVIELGTVTKLVTSGSRGWSQYIAPTGSLFVRSQNIGLGEFRYDDVVYVQPPENIEAKRAKIEPYDLLISVTGEPGNVAVATEELGLAHVSQHVALTRLKKPELARWFGVALASPSGQRQFRSKMYGQTRPGLNLDNIDELRVALPEREERDDICQMVEAVSDREKAATGHLDRLLLVKAALSQALLTGRVRVPITPHLTPVRQGAG